MKISLALGPRRTLSRQSAWGCFTTNLALPGFGSLAGGRISGYPQAVLALTGFAMTTIFGARFFAWYVANSSRLHSDLADPLASLSEIWTAARWALLGVAVFFAGWLWALGTSWRIIETSKRGEAANIPPRLA